MLGAFFYVDTSPGIHGVSIFTEAQYKTTVFVSTNAESYVKCSVLPGVLVGRIIPKVVNEADGLRALQGLHYAKTTKPQR